MKPSSAVVMSVLLGYTSDNIPLYNLEHIKRRHVFCLKNDFRDTNVYRSYNDITNELKRFWWPDDIKVSEDTK